MKVIPQSISDVLLIEPPAFGDSRGFFLESWSARRYAEHGIPEDLVQDNVSFSTHGTLRGLHAQHPRGQGKLVQVLHGEVFDVALDIRVGSPTFGEHVGAMLSAENHRQMWIPPGFAHGFYVVSATALFQYKCSDYYAPENEIGVLWNDPALEILWPAGPKRLSSKDEKAPLLRSLAHETLPSYGEELCRIPVFS